MALLRLDSVAKSYWRGPREERVLRDVSLEVRAGELVGVYGQRGAGKTTLLRIAAGFEQPDRGSVAFEDIALARRSRRQRARVRREDIAWVERTGPHSRELPMRVHVGLSLYREFGPVEAQRRAGVALARIGAQDAVDARWGSLSDTTRVLVAIAHALVREPKLLIVDDPTAGLSIVDREHVVGLLRAAAEDGLGVLMAVPELPAMLHAHEVRALSRGRLFAPDTPPPDSHGTVVEFPGGERFA